MLKRSESIEDRATDSGLLEGERKLINVIGPGGVLKRHEKSSRTSQPRSLSEKSLVKLGRV